MAQSLGSSQVAVLKKSLQAIVIPADFESNKIAETPFKHFQGSDSDSKGININEKFLFRSITTIWSKNNII